MIKIKNDLPYYIKKAEQNDKYGDAIIAFPDDYVVLDLETLAPDCRPAVR